MLVNMYRYVCCGLRGVDDGDRDEDVRKLSREHPVEPVVKVERVDVRRNAPGGHLVAQRRTYHHIALQHACKFHSWYHSSVQAGLRATGFGELVASLADRSILRKRQAPPAAGSLTILFHRFHCLWYSGSDT